MSPLGRLHASMPKGLYTRSLLIIILPMILLQAVLVFVFLDRHWQLVTRRLSAAVAGDVAAVINLYRVYPHDLETLRRIAADDLSLAIGLLPGAPLPAPKLDQKFSLLAETLSAELSGRIDRPFRLDTLHQDSFIEIRVGLDGAVMRIVARRSLAYASNWHIFLVWMVVASAVLTTVAILFLRNQIRPILRLADAAEAFGKGREVQDFRPRGAREVRRASAAFVAMKDRIERQIEQRTTMLAGVSHDLRTVLTRFKLEIALLGRDAEKEALRADIAEMERMLEGYLAFARGDAGEQARPVDLSVLIGEVAADAGRVGDAVSIRFDGDPIAIIRPNALKRCLTNLVANAARFGTRVAVAGRRDTQDLVITVDDDGPGIPEERREDVFRPFFRLDEARNQDHGGSGLGLAIARDVARAHGGELLLATSPLGGLRAIVRIPT